MESEDSEKKDKKIEEILIRMTSNKNVNLKKNEKRYVSGMRIERFSKRFDARD